MRFVVLLAACVPLACAPLRPPSLSPRAAETAGFDPGRLARIDTLVENAIQARQLPGAVVLVGRGDRTVSVKAYGNRALVPSVEPMTVDTIFDVASLTKVVATTASVMALVEQGRIRLNDRVAAHIPGFGRYGKDQITVRHLLTHVSGLRPDLDLNVPFEGSARAIELAAEEVPESAPGERFVYSDINFFLLGEIVARAGGEPLDAFARRHVFEPLGMTETTFRPPKELEPRIAPTERCQLLAWPCDAATAPMLRGIVHDPTARRMGGVAGHAGLFSTASDLARFARALLRGGELDGRRVLAPLTVAKMIEPASPEDQRSQRALGWDVDSGFSSNRGELLPIGSFGHTGFTGTSMWIDPATELYVIFLSNRVHPDGTGDVTPLRARVATAAAAAFVGAPRMNELHQLQMTGRDFIAPAPASAEPVNVRTGIDVLKAEGFARLHGRRVALLTNVAARATDGATTFDVLRSAPGVQLVSIFSPEHGLAAVLDTKVASGTDERTGIMVHSLYGETQRPTQPMLQGIDTVVVDLVDVGARFYTYATTVAYVMEEAAKRGIRVVVLDRPNPIGGVQIEGPGLDPGIEGLTSYFPPMPIRHGLTLGELARLFNAEKRIGADLSVVEARGWRRDLWFDETGLPWSNPSPNMRNLHQASVYPGIGAIEWTNISVGRGTDTPFEQIGAPWVDGVQLADALNRRRVPGVRFYPVQFTPASSVYANELCRGVFIVVTDRRALRPVRLGIELAAALQRQHPDRFDFRSTVRLLGSQATIDRIRGGDDPSEITRGWSAAEESWRRLRAPYLLYR